MPQQLADSTDAYYAPQQMARFSADNTADSLPQASLPMLHSFQPADFIAADCRQQAPLHDNLAMTLLVAAVLAVLMVYRNGYKYVKRLGHNLFNVRRRENMFDDNTADESRILAALISLLCVSQGLLLYEALPSLLPQLAATMTDRVGLHVAALAMLALIFFLLQLAAYHLLCYVFADKEETRLWLAGFKASPFRMPAQCCCRSPLASTSAHEYCSFAKVFAFFAAI